MFRSPLLVLLFPIFQIPYVLSQTEEPAVLPEVDGSYIAVGEIVIKNSGDGDLLQVKFDETFDPASGSAAFTIHERGENITFIENALINQTFVYAKGVCAEFSVKEWVDVSAPPSLMGYEMDDGKVKFSLKQLFDIPNEYVVPEEAGKAGLYRDIPARSWLYRIGSEKKDNKTSVIDIYSYWSDGSWKTTSSFGQIVPLGFTITRMDHDENDKKMLHSEQYINIYSFIHDAVDIKQFEPRQGIPCPGKKSLFAFPEMPKLQAISFKSEVVFPDQSEVKTMDVWYDMKNGYHKMNLDRIKQGSDGKYRQHSSVITSKTADTSYFINIAKAIPTCDVKPTSQYDWDYQQIINPKLDLKSWNMETLFGLDSTEYTYIGKTSKRNIPCHLFQGTREDWPTEDVGIESLWEWCIVATLWNGSEAVNFIDGGNINVVSAQITFSQEKLKEELKISETDTATIVHHFYDVIEEDPLNMDFSTFDISLCFTPEQQRRIEFAVDIKVNKDNFEQVENATSDPAFLNAWKMAISEKSKLNLNTLRLTKVKSMVWGGNLLVSFTVLGVHPNLAKDAKQNKPTLEEAINNLNDSVKAGQLQIKFAWAKDKEPETLAALKDTLNDIIIKPPEIPIIPTPIPAKSTTPSGIIFSLKTPSESSTEGGSTGGGKTSTKTPDGASTSTKTPDGGSTSTKTPDGGSTSTESPLTKKVFKGHKPGAVAGVSIAMLIVGISLGAGGTYFKLKIMPRH